MRPESNNSNPYNISGISGSNGAVKGYETVPVSPSQKKKIKEKYQQDNNFRAAVMHVVLDAFVSVLVIFAIVTAGLVPHQKAVFLDPLVAIIGSFVIISWGYTLIVDTGANLLDICPDIKMTAALKERLERERDGALPSKVQDLHVWRLGPGHLGCIIAIATS